jgi:hypothetical protein
MRRYIMVDLGSHYFGLFLFLLFAWENQMDEPIYQTNIWSALNGESITVKQSTHKQQLLPCPYRTCDPRHS